MNLPFELFVALRYLVARRKQAFVSVISFVSILGVTVGVTALLIALALMTGLQGELRDRIIGASAHIYVFKLGKGIEDYDAEIRKLREFPHVVGAAPGVIGKALVTSSGDRQAFLTLKGIDPKLEPMVTDIKNAMRSGSIDGIIPHEDQMDGIVLGKDAAETLGVSVGDIVRVLSPEGTLTPIGVMPRSRSFRVAGTFSLGLYEFDSEYGFMALPVG
jgi:lipoprotein-releasing system permease protein